LLAAIRDAQAMLAAAHASDPSQASRSPVHGRRAVGQTGAARFTDHLGGGAVASPVNPRDGRSGGLQVQAWKAVDLFKQEISPHPTTLGAAR